MNAVQTAYAIAKSAIETAWETAQAEGHTDFGKWIYTDAPLEVYELQDELRKAEEALIEWGISVICQRTPSIGFKVQRLYKAGQLSKFHKEMVELTANLSL